MAVLGIDLGTTNSLAAVWKDGRVQLIADDLGNLMVPSVVAVDTDGNILTGQAAREEGLIHPERCASSFKRFMGTEKVYRLADRDFTPEELSALILKKLKAMAVDALGEEITECVISVPAYFNNDQRYATKLAAELAGIKCERLINEPSAAALMKRRLDSESEQIMMVFDFGGGTLDISIVDCFENIVEITTVAGDNHLGGTDFDKAIALAFCRENGLEWEGLEEIQQNRLLYESRRCKEMLSRQKETELVLADDGECRRMSLTTEKLLQIGEKIFRKIKNVVSRALTDSGLTLADISCILLAGGSSRMPAVKLFLSRLLGREVETVSEPDLLIAQGIGVYTGIKERNEELKDILMTDVCPFSLGIEVVGERGSGPTRMCMMIERNSILPCRESKQFRTVTDFQEEIAVNVYQGENYSPDKNLKIGEILTRVPPAPAGQESITVTFVYNINGLLEVSVLGNTTHKEAKAVFVSGYRHMTAEQVSAEREKMEALSFLSREEEEHKAILAMGERLYAETTGQLRQFVGQVIAGYDYVWNTKSPVRIRKQGSETMRKLLAVEMGMKRDPFSSDWDDFDWDVSDEDE